MGVVPVDNAHPALFEQQALAALIFLEAGMFVGADMVRFQIGKNAQVKHKTLGTVKHQPLGGHFHDHRVHARFHHPCKVFLQRIGFRGGIARMDALFADNHLNGSHQSHLVTRVFQYGFHHVGGGSLPLGAGDADHPQFLRRIAKVSRGDKRQGIPGIGNPDHRHILPDRLRHLPGHHQCPGPLLHGFRRKIMSVKIGSSDADKQAALHYFPGIIHHLADLQVRAAQYAFVLQLAQQICQFHDISPSLPAGSPSTYYYK